MNANARPMTPACLCAAFFACAAQAGVAPDLADLSIEALMQVKVESASKFAQPLAQAPSSVSVVTREEIRAHGWRNLAEILRSLRGLAITQDRSYTYLGVRGLSVPGDYNTRFLLLVDGYRVNDAIYEQAYVGNEFLLDAGLIERVEFVPGAGSSIYGSNAVQGVINVITRRDAEGAQLHVEAGSLGERRARFQWARTFDQGDLLFSISRLDHTGRALDLPGIGPTPAAMDAETADKAYLKWRSGNLTLSAAFMQRDKATPAAPFGTDRGAPGTGTRDRQFFASLHHETELTPATRMQTLAYLGQMSYRGSYLYSGVTEQEITDGAWWGAELRGLTRSAAHKLVYGVEYQDNHKQDMRYASAAASPLVSIGSWRSGLYIQDEWTLDDALSLNAGVRRDRYSAYADATSPRLALILSGPTTWKLAYGSAYRTPSAYERHYADPTAAANPALRPETSKTWELIAERELAQGRLSGSLHRWRINDLIQQIGIGGGLNQYQNIGQVNGQGLEAGLDHALAGDWVLRASHAWQRVEKPGGGLQENAPRHLFKVRAHATRGAWRPALETLYVGDRRDLSGATATGYWLANASLAAHRLAPGLELSLHADNLFDRRYRDPVGRDFANFSQIPQDGRSLRLRLAYSY